MTEEIREGTLTPVESPEILLRKRSDFNAEITEAIDQDRFEDALKMLKEVEELDVALDGEVANSTLIRFTDANAGLRNWPEAAQYGATLREKVKRDIDELKAKAEREPLAAAESINLQSLPQLLAIVERRLPLFQDYGQRLSSIRELLMDTESSESDLHKNVVELRLRLFLAALPEALRAPVQEIIDKLAKKKKVTSKDKEYREIVDVVCSYIVDYFVEADPKNERYFIDPIFYEDIDPKEREKLQKVTNPLAWEDRIKNRAQKMLQRKSDFIAENSDVFEGLRSQLERVFHYFD